MKSSTILFLGQAVALLSAATCHALDFTIPENIVIGKEVTVEWAGTPSLDTSDQSVVLFKGDEALVSLCHGLVSGSGKCTFTLAEDDVKTLERGNSGYHIGLQGENDITLDISKDFGIRSAKGSTGHDGVKHKKKKQKVQQSEKKAKKQREKEREEENKDDDNDEDENEDEDEEEEDKHKHENENEDEDEDEKENEEEDEDKDTDEHTDEDEKEKAKKEKSKKTYHAAVREKPWHRKEEHEEIHKDKHRSDEEPQDPSHPKGDPVHHHHHQHSDPEAPMSSEYETLTSTYGSTSVINFAVDPSSSSSESSPTSTLKSQATVMSTSTTLAIDTSLTSTSCDSAAPASSSPEPAEANPAMALDDSQKQKDIEQQAAKKLRREKEDEKQRELKAAAEEKEEEERKQRNPEADVEDTWAQVMPTLRPMFSQGNVLFGLPLECVCMMRMPHGTFSAVNIREAEAKNKKAQDVEAIEPELWQLRAYGHNHLKDAHRDMNMQLRAAKKAAKKAPKKSSSSSSSKKLKIAHDHGHTLSQASVAEDEFADYESSFQPELWQLRAHGHHFLLKNAYEKHQKMMKKGKAQQAKAGKKQAAVKGEKLVAKKRDLNEKKEQRILAAGADADDEPAIAPLADGEDDEE
ncbi:hypothetical protein BGZ70_010015, partial [Mortierella alpina]